MYNLDLYGIANDLCTLFPFCTFFASMIYQETWHNSS